MRYSLEEQFHPCPACRQVNSTRFDVCPNCGRVLHATAIRVRGTISLVLGLLLTGGMSYLLVWVATIIRHSADPGATTRFNGGPVAAAGIFALLGFVLAFGLVSSVLGGWMLRYGWRNARLKRLVLVFGLLFWLASVLINLLKLF
jgi:hypothetical protein